MARFGKMVMLWPKIDAVSPPPFFSPGTVDYENKSKGHSLKYGEEERWKKVAELYGTTKSSKGKRSKGAGVNDRRPPDTTEALLKNQSSKNIDKDNGDLSVSDKKEQKQKAIELPKKYQSYPHWRSSCYITSFLELLYTNYLHTTMWWTTNVGVIPSNSGLKKLYTSFTIRDTVNTPGTKNVKSTFNEAREIVHHHVLEKKCQEDNQFGSLTHWFENIILKEKESTKLIDGQNYNSSHQLDFPFQLCYEENNIPIEYILTARVYSTSSRGMAVLESKDLTSLSGNKPQTVLVAYRLKDSNIHSIYSNNKTKTFLEKLNRYNIKIPNEETLSGIDLIEYFWDKVHQYYNTNNEGEDDEIIQKESEPDSSNKKYKRPKIDTSIVRRSSRIRKNIKK
ncbi:9718_t:CDS:2 [Entrophospora sp. SA101]|nr:9718_t:CDS:2 [Entrophospora sp. SA101]